MPRPLCACPWRRGRAETAELISSEVPGFVAGSLFAVITVGALFLSPWPFEFPDAGPLSAGPQIKGARSYDFCSLHLADVRGVLLMNLEGLSPVLAGFIVVAPPAVTSPNIEWHECPLCSPPSSLVVKPTKGCVVTPCFLGARKPIFSTEGFDSGFSLLLCLVDVLANLRNIIARRLDVDDEAFPIAARTIHQFATAGLAQASRRTVVNKILYVIDSVDSYRTSSSRGNKCSALPVPARFWQFRLS